MEESARITVDKEASKAIFLRYISLQGAARVYLQLTIISVDRWAVEKTISPEPYPATFPVRAPALPRVKPSATPHLPDEDCAPATLPPALEFPQTGPACRSRKQPPPLRAPFRERQSPCRFSCLRRACRIHDAAPQPLAQAPASLRLPVSDARLSCWPAYQSSLP